MIAAKLITGGIVMVGSRPVLDAIILCEGTSLTPVNGALIHEKDEVFFVTNTQPDMKKLIDLTETLIDTVTANFVPTSGGAAAAMAAVKVQLELLKATLI